MRIWRGSFTRRSGRRCSGQSGEWCAEEGDRRSARRASARLCCFCASSPARNGEERCVCEERDAGGGRGWRGGRAGWERHGKKSQQVHSYSARNDTAVPSARGGRRVRLAPANTGGDGYISRYYNRHGGGGGGGQHPHFLRVTRRRRSWHAPLLSSPHRRRGVRSRSAPFSKASLRVTRFILLQPSGRLMLHLHLHKKNTARGGRKQQFWIKRQRVILFSATLVLVYSFL